MDYSERQIRKEVSRQLLAKAKDYAERGLSVRSSDCARLAKHVENGGLIDPQQENRAKSALGHRHAAVDQENQEPAP